KIAPDRCLLVVGIPTGKHEVIVGDRRLAREDRVAARDLVEGMDGKWRRAVGGGKQVTPDPQGAAGSDLSVLIDSMCPHDLLRAAQPAGKVALRPRHLRTAIH